MEEIPLRQPYYLKAIQELSKTNQNRTAGVQWNGHPTRPLNTEPEFKKTHTRLTLAKGSRLGTGAIIRRGLRKNASSFYSNPCRIEGVANKECIPQSVTDRHNHMYPNFARRGTCMYNMGLNQSISCYPSPWLRVHLTPQVYRSTCSMFIFFHIHFAKKYL
jgi:hypothetical protein